MIKELASLNHTNFVYLFGTYRDEFLRGANDDDFFSSDEDDENVVQAPGTMNTSVYHQINYYIVKMMLIMLFCPIQY